MASKSRHSIVGVIPTGTANVWAREIGLPEDPVAACLSLVNSEARKVDLGHVEVEALAIPSRDNGQPQAVRSAAGGVHHFLLSLIHISEPTRLLSISYAVFCLKK